MRRGFTFARRLTFGAQVLLAVGLSIVACVLVLDLAAWRFVRVDLSATGRNTLDPALEELVEGLPEKVTIDAFYDPLRAPYNAISFELQARMQEFLRKAYTAHRDRLDVREYSSADVERVKARQAELRVDGQNLIVVSSGERRAVLNVLTDLADVDWGNPTQRGVEYLIGQGIALNLERWDPYRPTPPRFLSFRGAEAFAQALKKVSILGSPHVYVSQGHGEPDPYGQGAETLSPLRRALELEGFEVETWEAARDGPVPEDCDVLAILGATQPLGAAALEHVREFVDVRGGRVVVAVSAREAEDELPGGAMELLRGYGLVVQPGIVCQPVVDAVGQPAEGIPQCAALTVTERGMNAGHPLTEPLRRHGRSLQFFASHSFQRTGVATPGRLVLDLVSSDRDSWRDLPDAEGRHDWRHDPGRDGERERNVLCALAEVVTQAEGPGLQRARILGLAESSFVAAPEVFAWNRDFLVNAFNWLAERDYRVGVATRDPMESRIDLSRGRASSFLGLALQFGLPLLFGATGFFVYLRRRR